MQITDQQFALIAKVGVPLILGIVDRIRARHEEPTLEAVQAELASDEARIRAEAHAFYARHPELHPGA